MTDDIVTRLWEAGRLARNGQMDRDDIGDLLDWCADTIDLRDAEIERLRAEVARLGSFLHPVGTVVNGYSGSHAETTWISSDGTITNHDPDTEMGFWVRLFHNECDRSAHLEREVERLHQAAERWKMVAWLGHKVIFSKWEYTQFEQAYEEAIHDP